jgi:hypothetical protein
VVEDGGGESRTEDAAGVVEGRLLNCEEPMKKVLAPARQRRVPWLLMVSVPPTKPPRRPLFCNSMVAPGRLLSTAPKPMLRKPKELTVEEAALLRVRPLVTALALVTPEPSCVPPDQVKRVLRLSVSGPAKVPEVWVKLGGATGEPV